MKRRLGIAISIFLLGLAGGCSPVDAPTLASSSRPTHHTAAIWPCAAFKPHTGDPTPWFAAWNNENNPNIDTADCATTHPGGTDHIYCVVEWQTNPRQYTWQSGWC